MVYCTWRVTYATILPKIAAKGIDFKRYCHKRYRLEKVSATKGISNKRCWFSFFTRQAHYSRLRKWNDVFIDGIVTESYAEIHLRFFSLRSGYPTGRRIRPSVGSVTSWPATHPFSSCTPSTSRTLTSPWARSTASTLQIRSLPLSWMRFRFATSARSDRR